MTRRTSLLGTLAVLAMLAPLHARADPLHEAAARGDMKEVSRLIAEGADLEAKRTDGATALILAAENGHPGTVTMLLSNGADAEAKHDSGVSALFLASQNGHEEIVDLLLSDGANPTSGAMTERPPFFVPPRMATVRLSSCFCLAARM